MLNFLRHCLGGSCAVFSFLLVLSQSVGATEVLTKESNSEALANKITIPQEVALVSSELSLIEEVDIKQSATDKTGNSIQQNSLEAQVSSVSQLTVEVSSSKNSQSSSIQQQQKNTASNQPMAQVTSVSQLSDIQPTDWAFVALQSLVERYGCIAGYPNRTYRGNQALTRYEFAAGLNACLDRINELIATATTDLATREDLVTLQRLQEEFSAELTTLRGRVDTLEATTAELEANQFSTTTKLVGQALFALVDVFGDEAVGGGDLEFNTILSERVRLIFDTSFSGKDRLITRLQAGNTPDLNDSTGTRMSRLAFTSPSNNDIAINQLEYRFPLGDKGTVFIEAFGFLDLFVPTLHPLDGDYNTVISGFALRSPIYFQSGLAGIGFNYNFSESISIGGGYLAGDPTTGDPATGLFNGPYGALAQLTIRPSETFAFALTYVRGYDDGSGNAPPGGFFGSQNATFPFGPEATPALPPETAPGEPNPLPPAPVATSYDSYGIEAEYRLSPKFILSGWAGLTQAEAKSGANEGANADIFYWAVVLSFPDLGKEGNLGGIIFGQPSKVTSNDVEAFEDPDTSYVIEAFYRYQITDRISVTPGLVVVTNPEHNDSNSTDYIGVLRTVFDF